MKESVKMSSFPTVGFNLDSENTTQCDIIFRVVDSFLTYLATEITAAGKNQSSSQFSSPLVAQDIQGVRVPEMVVDPGRVWVEGLYSAVRSRDIPVVHDDRKGKGGITFVSSLLQCFYISPL